MKMFHSVKLERNGTVIKWIHEIQHSYATVTTNMFANDKCQGGETLTDISIYQKYGPT